MRELKFRAWHEESKMMHDVKGIDFIHHGGLVDISMLGYAPLKKVILMQYTGLHDRNGREIYEGDILRTERMEFSDSGHYIGMVEVLGQVVYRECMFRLQLTNGSMPELWFGSKYHEVIGNIYENPELLRGEETE